MEKNWVLSADQCQLQALQLLVHLIDLLSLLHRRNGFARFRKLWWIRQAVDHQTMTMTFLGANLSSLVAQRVKNLPAMQETWVRSLAWEDPLEKGKGYPLQYSCLENSMDYTVHGVTKSWTRQSDFHFQILDIAV